MNTEQVQTIPSLADILKHDATHVVNAVREFVRDVLHEYTARSFAKGALHGLYSPFLLTTGISRLNKISDDYVHKWVETDDRSFFVEAVSDLSGQVISALGSQALLASYSISQGRGKEYFGALLAANIADYLINANRR